MVADFPCVDLQYCGVVNGPCLHNGNLDKCKKGRHLKMMVTKVADSGVFTKEGSPLDYTELFSRYNQMGVERGIMLDVLRDKNGTIESAKSGYEEYSKGDNHFTLVGVAQGNTVEEYIECYESLLNIGYEEIAIGGLVTKKEATARYAHSNKDHIKSVVEKVKSEWPDNRCFTLGVYNPKRHEFLDSLGVDGADYKGWIFQYKKRYQDPVCHHIDRVQQTRSFIEKEILSKMSDNEISLNSINSIALNIKKHGSLSGNRVHYGKKRQMDLSTINETDRVIIISCGKAKNIALRSCKAEDAYIGRSFSLKKKYAETEGKSWFILSAKYGLIRPERIINPDYDETVSSENDIKSLASKIKRQISNYLEIVVADDIYFLGPQAYVKSLEIALHGKDKNIIHLTQGLKQGQSQKMIKDLISEKSAVSSHLPEKLCMSFRHTVSENAINQDASV
jgi:hypothetical protein